MGKFKVKPTRAVAKPFKSAAAFIRGGLISAGGGGNPVVVRPLPTKEDDFDDASSEDEGVGGVGGGSGNQALGSSSSGLTSMKPGVVPGGTQSGRVSKAKKRKSVRAKRQQKSVSFSKNLTEVGKRTGKNAAKVVDDIVQSHAALLLPSGHALQGILKGSPSKINSVGSDPSVVPIALNAPLNKILRKDIADKKARIKARKEIFRKKLGLIKAQQEEAKAARARQKTVIVGDMKPMTSILDALQVETKLAKKEKESTQKNKVPVQPRKKKKFSVAQRQQDLLDGLAFFKNALR